MTIIRYIYGFYIRPKKRKFFVNESISNVNANAVYRVTSPNPQMIDPDRAAKVKRAEALIKELKTKFGIELYAGTWMSTITPSLSTNVRLSVDIFGSRPDIWINKLETLKQDLNKYPKVLLHEFLPKKIIIFEKADASYGSRVTLIIGRYDSFHHEFFHVMELWAPASLVGFLPGLIDAKWPPLSTNNMDYSINKAFPDRSEYVYGKASEPDNRAEIASALLNSCEYTFQLMFDCKYNPKILEQVERLTSCKFDPETLRFTRMYSEKEMKDKYGYKYYPYYAKWSKDNTGKIWMDHNFWNNLLPYCGKTPEMQAEIKKLYGIEVVAERNKNASTVQQIDSARANLVFAIRHMLSLYPKKYIDSLVLSKIIVQNAQEYQGSTPATLNISFREGTMVVPTQLLNGWPGELISNSFFEISMTQTPPEHNLWPKGERLDDFVFNDRYKKDRDASYSDDRQAIGSVLLSGNIFDVWQLLEDCSKSKILLEKVERMTACKFDAKNARFERTYSEKEMRDLYGTGYQYFAQWSRDAGGKIWMDHAYWNSIKDRK